MLCSRVHHRHTWACMSEKQKRLSRTIYHETRCEIDLSGSQQSVQSTGRSEGAKTIRDITPPWGHLVASACVLQRRAGPLATDARQVVPIFFSYFSTHISRAPDSPSRRVTLASILDAVPGDSGVGLFVSSPRSPS